jgi:periplasmic copper chaperone A
MRGLVAIVLAGGVSLGSALAAPQVAVTGAWARATLPHQTNGVAYLTLQSAGGDTLTGVDSDAAGMVMLHRSSQKNGVASMDDVDSLTLSPGQAVTFSPGSLHLMLMDVKRALKAGDVVHLTLHLTHAGDVAVDAPVLPAGATGPVSH